MAILSNNSEIVFSGSLKACSVRLGIVITLPIIPLQRSTANRHLPVQEVSVRISPQPPVISHQRCSSSGVIRSHPLIPVTVIHSFCSMSF